MAARAWAAGLQMGRSHGSVVEGRPWEARAQIAFLPPSFAWRSSGEWWRRGEAGCEAERHVPIIHRLDHQSPQTVILPPSRLLQGWEGLPIAACHTQPSTGRARPSAASAEPSAEILSRTGPELSLQPPGRIRIQGTSLLTWDRQALDGGAAVGASYGARSCRNTVPAECKCGEAVQEPSC